MYCLKILKLSYEGSICICSIIYINTIPKNTFFFVFIFRYYASALHVGCFDCTQSTPPILKACALIDHHNDPDYKALLYKKGQKPAPLSTGLTLYVYTFQLICSDLLKCYVVIGMLYRLLLLLYLVVGGITGVIRLMFTLYV